MSLMLVAIESEDQGVVLINPAHVSALRMKKKFTDDEEDITEISAISGMDYAKGTPWEVAVKLGAKIHD